MQIDLLKVGSVLLLFAIASSMVIQSNTNAPFVLSNLEFGNNLGPNTTQSQLTSFINYVNSGGSFFRNDNYARFEYISNNMNKEYGNSDYGFSLIQQGDEAEWGLATINRDGIFGSIAPGTDRIFPTHSYMFLRENIYPSGRIYFNSVGQKGGGITPDLEQIIKDTILKLEPNGACKCNTTCLSLINELGKYDGGNWNAFCSAENSMYAMVYANSNKYSYTKPKNCYYALYKT